MPRARASDPAGGGPGEAAQLRAGLEGLYQEAAAAFAKITSAYQCELAASSIVGEAYQYARGVRAEGLAEYCNAFIRQVAEHRNRQAAGILAGLGAVAPAGAAERARVAVQRLARRKVSIPAWAGQVGLVKPSSAWQLKDVYGDMSQFIIAFEYQDAERAGVQGLEGAEDHAVCVLVDHNDGVVRELGVYAPASNFIQGVRRTEVRGVTMTQVDPATVRAEALDAITRTDQLPKPPGGKEYMGYWALALARVTGLQEGGAGGRPPALGASVRTKMVNEFLTAMGGTLVQPDGPVPVDTAKVIARLAIDYAIEANSGNPMRWSPAAVESFLTRWLPRQQDEVELWLAEVLGALVFYSGKLTRLPIEAMRVTVEKIAECWQYRQSLAETAPDETMDEVYGRMAIAGVDLKDDAAVRRWMTDYVDAQEAAGRTGDDRPAPDPGSSNGSGAANGSGSSNGSGGRQP